MANTPPSSPAYVVYGCPGLNLNSLNSELADEDLGEDDVFVLESIAEAQKNEEDKLRVTLILTLKDSMTALAKVIKIIEVKMYLYTTRGSLASLGTHSEAFHNRGTAYCKK